MVLFFYSSLWVAPTCYGWNLLPVIVRIKPDSWQGLGSADPSRMERPFGSAGTFFLLEHLFGALRGSPGPLRGNLGVTRGGP